MIEVLFIIYDLERGGPEMRLLNLARTLPPDIRMHLCVTSTNLAMQDDFKECGVPITVIPIRKPWFEPGKLAAIARYCRDQHIDVVNVFDLKGLFVAAYLKITGSRVPVVFHHVGSFEALSRRRQLLLRLMLGSAGHYICNSNFSMGELCSLVAANRIHVVHNGIDTTRFIQDSELRQRIRADLQINDDCILLGIVANLRPEKNPHLLVEGFSRLAQSHDAVKLLIVGGGSLLEWTKQLVEKLGLTDRVIFTGYTKDVSSMIQAMDIMVLTSISEGLPTVLLEAMAMGKPVITSDAGGSPEIVTHGVTGFIFRSTDLDGFVAAMDSLVSDSALTGQMAAAAHDDIHRHYTLERMVSRYAELFRDIAMGGY